MRKVVCSAIIIASFGISILNAELLPAKNLKVISEKATKEAIAKFKKDKKCKAAYNETKKFIADRLNKVASEGFYNIVYVNINDI